jgi:hypothetical protein
MKFYGRKNFLVAVGKRTKRGYLQFVFAGFGAFRKRINVETIFARRVRADSYLLGSAPARRRVKFADEFLVWRKYFGDDIYVALLNCQS